MDTRNCQDCGALVWEVDIVGPKGFCKDCEIKRLKKENVELRRKLKSAPRQGGLFDGVQD